MIPSVGRIVHYNLSASDAAAINAPHEPGKSANKHAEGQVVPLLICRVWSDYPTEGAAVNGQAFVDGNFSLWVTSRVQGTDSGQWSDPREA